MDSKTDLCFSIVFVTLGSTGNPPKSELHAMCIPVKSLSRGCLKISPDIGIEIGERESGPAIALSIKAASLTVRAIGPCTDIGNQLARDGQTGTLPGEGRNPTTLQKLAGLRRDPPISLPSAIGCMPHARATAAPPLLPPQVLVIS